MAIAAIGVLEAYGLIVLPIPPNVPVPYDIPKGMHEARDGMFKAMGATMTSDKDFVVGGLPGRLAVGKASLQGTDMRIELRLAFDKPHNTMVGLMELTKSEDSRRRGRRLPQVVHGQAGDPPPTGDGTK